MNEKLEAEKQQQLEEMASKGTGDKSSKGGKQWSEMELQILIKGVNVFPAGTKDRYVLV